MYKLELTMVLHFAPPMDERGYGIRLTRMFELPFPPAEGLLLASKSFGEGDEGLKLKNVTWDVDRKQFFASTGVISQNFPIAFIPDEIRSWIERGWTLVTGSIFGDGYDGRSEEGEEAQECTEGAADQAEDEWEEAENWPRKSARRRPAKFNKVLQALVREMAALHNNLATAYAIDKSKMFFTEKEWRDEETAATKRFQEAFFEFDRLTMEERIKWQQGVIERYPKLREIVLGIN